MTDAERCLWARLRQKQIGGFRFRRQQLIGPYIVDFFCPAASMIIEVDGGQHDERQADDAARTAWLNGRGYRMLRFWNNEILGNIEGVLETVDRALREDPPPQPSPSRGEGDES
jgi:very-short-patch-repair endonuclease